MDTASKRRFSPTILFSPEVNSLADFRIFTFSKSIELLTPFQSG